MQTNWQKISGSRARPFVFGNHLITGFAGLQAMIRFVTSRMLLLIPILLFAVYSCLIIYCWLSWIKIPVYVAGNGQAAVKVAVIIPARNEEENIGRLLRSLEQQSYPRALTEIIVVDDHSTDDTARKVRESGNVLLVELKNEGINSYKKKAIETGIANTNAELIITTDADCIAGPDWIKTIVSFRAEHPSVFIAAPVSIPTSSPADKKFLLYFQALDFLVLQGITGVAVHQRTLSMCNGANLAYEKKIFEEVGGFSGIDHIASGDDMLLMHKIRSRYPDRVHYIKSRDAIVYTKPAGSWPAFFNQRIRWASKANKYEDRKIFPVLLLVYLFNFSFPVLLIAGGWNHQYWFWLLAFWVAKTGVELPFVVAVSGFFGSRSLLKYFFLFQPVHILYTLVAGWLGQFGTYEWKGRKVK